MSVKVTWALAGAAIGPIMSPSPSAAIAGNRNILPPVHHRSSSQIGPSSAFAGSSAVLFPAGPSVAPATENPSSSHLVLTGIDGDREPGRRRSSGRCPLPLSVRSRARCEGLEEDEGMLRIGAIATGAALLVASGAAAFDQTVGLFSNEPSASTGYTLFGPLGGATTYLIDNDGLLVNSWDGVYPSGHSSYILGQRPPSEGGRSGRQRCHRPPRGRRPHPGVRLGRHGRVVVSVFDDTRCARITTSRRCRTGTCSSWRGKSRRRRTSSRRVAIPPCSTMT